MSTREIYASTFDEEPAVDAEDCPECGGDVYTNSHETSCDDCGLVIGIDPIDTGSEWYDTDDVGTAKGRTGGVRTLTRHDNGLGTTIGHSRDGKGNPLSGGQRRRLKRFRREHGRAQRPTKRARNRISGLVDIRRLTGALELPESIQERASKLFRRAQDEDLLPGRSIEAMATAAVYAAARCRGLPVTQDELEPIARCDRSSLRNAVGVLNVELGVEFRPLGPSAFVPRIASEVEVIDRTRAAAVKVAEQAEAEGVANGQHPRGMAAGCIELVKPPTRVTQQALADAAQVSTRTVQVHRDRLQTELSELPEA